jgi:hypothetical protein
LALNEHWKHITHISSCPTEAELELYHNGTLPDGKRFGIENHLAGCEACNDYLEGLSVLPASVNLDEVEIELKGKINFLFEEKKQKRIIPVFYSRLGIAATILLLIGMAFYFTLHEKDITSDDLMKPTQEVAKTEKLEEVAPAPPVPTEKVPVIAQAKPLPENKPTKIETLKPEFLVSDSEDILVDEKLDLARSEDFNVSQLTEEKETAPVIMIRGVRSLSKGQIISGIVLDESGIALPGVTLLLKNTMNGTVSDMNGRFVVSADSGDTLCAQYIGFENNEYIITSPDSMEITMKASNLALDEVVNVGYGQVKKKEVTGAVSQVSTRKIKPGERSRLTKLNKEYTSIPDSVKDERTSILYAVEKELILKNKGKSIIQLKKLLLIIENNDEKETIQKAIKLIEKERYTSAQKLVRSIK